MTDTTPLGAIAVAALVAWLLVPLAGLRWGRSPELPIDHDSSEEQA